MLVVMLVVEPSPKSQNRLVMLPVELSVNVTSNGSAPSPGRPMKAATGGGTVRSLYAVAKLSATTIFPIVNPTFGVVPLANCEMLNEPTCVGGVAPPPMGCVDMAHELSSGRSDWAADFSRVFLFCDYAMDCCAGRSSNQRRLILLICVSSSGRQTGLIDLTTVRVAALPLSRLEGPPSGLLTQTRVRLNRAALCQRSNPLLS